MPVIASVQRAIDVYRGTIAELRAKKVVNEGGLRRAFSALLAELGKAESWTLIEEQTLTGRIRPDGIFRDGTSYPRGYWEAKDSNDDLEVEIRRKFDRGYPQINIIFEDGQRAILYQNRRRVLDADMADRGQLSALLMQFFAYTRENIEEFHRAVEEFKLSIPDLALGLETIIEQERSRNQRFNTAFDTFHTLCKSAIDPNISADTIEKMLVQHLLTERLFRTVFNDPDFTRRNVIAEEIERVIRTLTWNRAEFLKQLDPFYRAIEDAARDISDFSEKQTFINSIYERFFQGYSRAQADTHGIVYTPQPIVDFMVASVDQVLQTEFGTTLSDEGVTILDPCTGTGNFIVNVLRRISRRDLKRKYTQELFANEIMLLPYYIASLNIEHTYQELTGEHVPFEGICFADTLDLTESAQLSLFAEENTERVRRQKNAKITVIIGNPPYNVGQVNENDNNKNRRHKDIDQRVRETYAKDSKATNKNALSDVYVKFFRWATDRLKDNDGIVCYVSNNSFVDQIAFDGVRKQLLSNFDQVYHLDLHGNVRQNPKLSGTTHNVFGIQVGVGITIAIRRKAATERFIKYYRVPENWTKVEKLAWIEQSANLSGVTWKTLQPDARQTWLTDGMHVDFDTFLPIGSKETKSGSAAEAQAIFKIYSRGVATSRDDWAYDFNREQLARKVQTFIELYNAEVDRWQRRTDRTVNVDSFVQYDDTKIKWSRDLKLDLQRGNPAQWKPDKIHSALYRPFVKQSIFLDRILNEEVYQQPSFFPTPATEAENSLIWLKVGTEVPLFALMTNCIPDLLPQGGSQCFPFYVYDEDGGNRRENITDWAWLQFQAAYGEVTKRDIFHYVYGLLHHPYYRAHYADNLKRELPRIPLIGTQIPSADPVADFRRFVEAGTQLATLHLNYETVKEYKLRSIENRSIPFTWRVSKMKLSADKTQIIVNESLTLADIPAECFRYRLGNRSALDWIIDQYQVSTDKRSGIVSDPNRVDDEEYIVRLIGRVITVSVETMKIVDGLPTWE